MKALSIRQPWAWLIVNGHKDIENRCWKTHLRGKIYVHAAKGMTMEEYAFAHALAEEQGIALPEFNALARGGIVGTVEIVEDALDAIDTTIRELTKIRDKAGRWAVWAEGKEGT